MEQHSPQTREQEQGLMKEAFFKTKLTNKEEVEKRLAFPTTVPLGIYTCVPSHPPSNVIHHGSIVRKFVKDGLHTHEMVGVA